MKAISAIFGKRKATSQSRPRQKQNQPKKWKRGMGLQSKTLIGIMFIAVLMLGLFGMAYTGMEDMSEKNDEIVRQSEIASTMRPNHPISSILRALYEMCLWPLRTMLHWKRPPSMQGWTHL